MVETCRMCGLDRASGHLSWCPAWGGWGSIPAIPLGTVGDGKLGVEENRVEPLAGTQAVMDAIDSSNALGRITSAVLVAIKNLEATEVAGIASIAHVIRSLKDVLAHV